MKMAQAVQLLAERTPGKEAQAIEGFARALRQVPFPFAFDPLACSLDDLRPLHSLSDTPHNVPLTWMRVDPNHYC